MLHLRNHTSKKDPVISGTFFENIFFYDIWYRRNNNIIPDIL
jgi:hypothetical protein